MILFESIRRHLHSGDHLGNVVDFWLQALSGGQTQMMSIPMQQEEDNAYVFVKRNHGVVPNGVKRSCGRQVPLDKNVKLEETE